MIFPDGYFREEERDGFVVPEMMKRAWGAAIEVLEVIADICSRNNIKWFADWGTLLGAIRHNGFIPWDDDIDIALLRPDYNRLLEILPGELPEGFVMTGMYAEDERLRKAGEVLQMRVIADETYWGLASYMNRFHCFPYPRIGIDIFPLDFVNRDLAKRKAQVDLVRELLHLSTMYDSIHDTVEFIADTKRMESLFEIDILNSNDVKNTLWRITDFVCSMCEADEADEVVHYTTLINKPKSPLKKEWYSEVVLHKFENMKIPVPIDSDKVLTVMYGDYRTPKRAYVSHDYPFYKKQESAMEDMLRASGVETDITTFCRNWETLMGQILD